MINLHSVQSGRDNLALTIMVPYDCDNNCKFCTSKKEYSINPPDKQKVISTVKKFFNSYGSLLVKDVVITGGEPMQDVYTLAEIVRAIPDRLNVYINTTFIKKNREQFVFFVNSQPKIKGVNISRHSDCFESDCKTMNGIAEDIYIKEFIKPVRINCVIGESTKNIESAINRWCGFENLEISFRADFTKTTNEELHNPFCAVNMFLNERYKFVNNTRCNVCDTTTFKTPGGMFVKYHKGLKTTSIKREGVLEVNDFVVSQSGKCYADWDFSNSKLIALSESNNFLASILAPLPLGGCGAMLRSVSSCGGGACG